MITLLRDLRQQVSSQGQARIDHVLASVGFSDHRISQQLADPTQVVEDVADAAATVQTPEHSVAEGDRGEANVSAEFGSSAGSGSVAPSGCIRGDVLS